MESDGKDKLIEEFRETAAGLKMSEIVRKVFDEELAELRGLEPAASEGVWNYLDWLTQVRSSFLLLCSIRYISFIDTLGSSLLRTTYAENVLNEDDYHQGRILHP